MAKQSKTIGLSDKDLAELSKGAEKQSSAVKDSLRKAASAYQSQVDAAYVRIKAEKGLRSKLITYKAVQAKLAAASEKVAAERMASSKQSAALLKARTAQVDAQLKDAGLGDFKAYKGLISRVSELEGRVAEAVAEGTPYYSDLRKWARANKTLLKMQDALGGYDNAQSILQDLTRLRRQAAFSRLSDKDAKGAGIWSEQEAANTLDAVSAQGSVLEQLSAIRKAKRVRSEISLKANAPGDDGDFDFGETFRVINARRLSELGTAIADAEVKLGGFKGILKTTFSDISDAAVEQSRRIGTALHVSTIGAPAGQAIGVAGALTVAASIAAVAADPAEEVGKLNRQTGVALDNLSALRHAAASTGIDFEELKSALVSIPLAVSEATSGDSSMLESFARLRINFEEFSKLKPDEQLLAFINRVGELKSGPALTEGLARILGEDAQRIIPLFKDIAVNGIGYYMQKARDAGVLFDQEAVKNATTRNKALRELGDRIHGLASAFAEGLLPAATDFNKAGSDVGSTLISIAKEAGEATSNIASLIVKLGELAAGPAKKVGGLATDALDTFGWAVGTTTGTIASSISSKGVISGILSSLPAVVDALKNTNPVGLGTAANAGMSYGKLPPPIPSIPTGPLPPLPSGVGLPPPIPAGKGVVEGSMQVDPVSLTQLQNKLSLDSQLLSNLQQKLATMQQIAQLGQDSVIAQSQAELDQGIMSYNDFLKTQENVAKAAYDYSLGNIEQQIKLATKVLEDAKALVRYDPATEATVSATAAQIEEFKRQKTLLTAQFKADSYKRAEEARKASVDAAQAVADAQASVASSLGDDSISRTLSRMKAISEFMTNIDKIQGLSDEARSTATQDYIAKLDQVAAAALKQKQFDEQSLALDIEKQRLTDTGSLNLADQAMMQQQIYELEKQRLPVLIQLVEAQLAMARAAGDTKTALELSGKLSGLQTLQKQAISSTDAMTGLGNASKDALYNGISSGLTNAIGNAASFEDQIKAVGRTIISELGAWAAKMLTIQILKATIGMPAAANGGLVADKLAVGGMPYGGTVHGGGTTTSDSVPTLLSRREFVIKAASAEQIGAYAFLSDFNARGMAAVADWAPVCRASGGSVAGVDIGAMGGYASQGSTTPSRVNLGLSLDPGLIAEYISSPAGQRVVLDVMHKNKRAIRSM